MKRLLLLGAAALLPFAVSAAEDSQPVPESTYVMAIVEEVLSEVPAEYGGVPVLQQQVRLSISGGEFDGEVFTMQNGVLRDQPQNRLQPGRRVVVERMVRPDGSVLHLSREPYRLPALGWLFGIFVLLGVLLGGIRGLGSAVGLVVSVAVLLLFVVPEIAAGGDPLLVSLVGSYGIACTSLFLAHGFHRRTAVAFLSTALTLAFAAAAAFLSVRFASLFGMGSEESVFLATGQFSGINLRGLLVGGFIIGTLGVLDDITTAQSAAVEEISKANPALAASDLLAAGMSVGREHIASLINTLALAYAGSSMPLLLLFHSDAGLPSWVVLNGEFIAEEIVRTLVGSTALLVAVPVSTWLAVQLLRNRTGKVLPSSSCGHHHH
jgi:uncharacterized membrane protein